MIISNIGKEEGHISRMGCISSKDQFSKDDIEHGFEESYKRKDNQVKKHSETEKNVSDNSVIISLLSFKKLMKILKFWIILSDIFLIFFVHLPSVKELTSKYMFFNLIIMSDCK